jgi:hypothetical protein
MQNIANFFYVWNGPTYIHPAFDTHPVLLEWTIGATCLNAGAQFRDDTEPDEDYDEEKSCCKYGHAVCSFSNERFAHRVHALIGEYTFEEQ